MPDRGDKTARSSRTKTPDAKSARSPGKSRSPTHKRQPKLTVAMPPRHVSTPTDPPPASKPPPDHFEFRPKCDDFIGRVFEDRRRTARERGASRCDVPAPRAYAFPGAARPGTAGIRDSASEVGDQGWSVERRWLTFCAALAHAVASERPPRSSAARKDDAGVAGDGFDAIRVDVRPASSARKRRRTPPVSTSPGRQKHRERPHDVALPALDVRKIARNQETRPCRHFREAADAARAAFASIAWHRRATTGTLGHAKRRGELRRSLRMKTSVAAFRSVSAAADVQMGRGWQTREG